MDPNNSVIFIYFDLGFTALSRMFHLYRADNSVIKRLWCIFFFQKTGLDIASKLSPRETICMKCHPIFWEKYEKYQFVVC